MKNKNMPQYDEEHEMKLVRKDFVFVVTLNLILFAAMIGLFFWNRSGGQLDNLLNHIIKF